jgi:hypothetical protein
MFIVTLLSHLSPIRSQFCLLATLPPHVEQATALIMLFTVCPSLSATRTIRLVLTRPAPAPRPFAPPTGRSPQSGRRPCPVCMPHRTCPWALPPLLTPRQPPLGGVWSQGRQAQWRAVSPVHLTPEAPTTASTHLTEIAAFSYALTGGAAHFLSLCATHPVGGQPSCTRTDFYS